MNKLEIINSMKVVDSSACSGELEYVYVDDTPENIQTIRQVGYVGAIEADEGVIDITNIGFEFGGAKWFEESLGGFITYIPEHAPEWAK